MKNNKLFYGFALLFLAAVVFFLGYSVSKNSLFNNHQDGKIILQDSLSISGVNVLHADCNCDIEIIPAYEERVVFFYDKKLHENKTAIKGDELTINFDDKKHFSFGWNNVESNVVVKVYTKGLKIISQEGIGDIECKSVLNADELTITNDGVGSMDLNLNANKLTIENSGVGSISIKGNSKNTILTNSGTGSIDAISLINKTAKVDNSGVGSVDVNATDSLNMNNSGVGGITYTGSAIITKIESDGVGTITKQ